MPPFIENAEKLEEVNSHSVYNGSVCQRGERGEPTNEWRVKSEMTIHSSR